jgi:hypothetical protein
VFGCERKHGEPAIFQVGITRPDAARDHHGQILKSDKPTDLPVWQSTKIKLIVNFKTAKASTPPRTIGGAPHDGGRGAAANRHWRRRQIHDELSLSARALT